MRICSRGTKHRQQEAAKTKTKKHHFLQIVQSTVLLGYIQSSKINKKELLFATGGNVN
jgi:hypothetical protein